MLRSLEIRDLLIIDHLELEFQSGLNVLTGETGAGKSILLDSLGFVLGWRGRAELVRAGAEQGEVQAVFDLPGDHPAHEVLQEAGLSAEDELILRRVNTRDGRKTAWVNDRRVSGDTLRALSDTLVELHGQQDDRGLLNPRGHLRLLDEFADTAALVEDTRAAWRAVRSAGAALEAAEATLAEMRKEEEFLRHAAKELDDLDPQQGEEEALDTQRRIMQVADRIRNDVARAYQALGTDGAEGMVGDAARWLDQAAGQAGEGVADMLTPALSALEQVQEGLGEALQNVERFVEELSFDPMELERTEERLFAIRALARKHNVLPDALADLAETFRQRLQKLDAGDADLAALKTALKAAQATYDTAAATLGDARAKAARSLDKQMAGELAPLKMERAVFETRIEPAEPGPEGRDSVAFTVATNPGAPAGPLSKIASGGELSRFLLALKVCLSRRATGLTMIFDEIDRGVGGATAAAVGRRLAALSVGQQVLVVTHSPQVAAQGAHHWRVEKQVTGDQTLSRVVPVRDDERIDELARMLSDETISEEARAAAKALLAGKEAVAD